jgi:mannose-6-phosphate isomerase-like protein (cupin superfamily)/mannose-1-phosphate guanylyltransferase
MLDTGSETATRTIVPVIMANRELRALWPWSVPGRPFPYNSLPGERCQLHALLDAVASIEAFDRPYLVISPNMLGAALDMLRNRGSRPPKFITVPAESGSGISAVIAALETVRESRNAVLVFLPATLVVEGNLDGYLRHLANLASITAQSGYTIISAERAQKNSSGLLLQACATNTKSGLLEVDSCLLPDSRDMIEIARDQRALWAANGPVIAVAGRILEMVSTLNPTLMQACQNALRIGRVSEAAVHPEQNFLSLVADPSVGRILAGHARSMLIDQSGSSVRVLRSWADFGRTELDKYRPSAPRIGTAGLPNHVLIEGPGGVLVAALSREHEAAACFGTMPVEPAEPYRLARSEQGPRQRSWGSEEIVDMALGVAVLRLEIAPGAAMESECHVHRTESWVVASGTGNAGLDNSSRNVRPGDHVVIPRGTVHSLRNIGAEKLVIYETRTGAIVGDEDRIGIQMEPDRVSA